MKPAPSQPVQAEPTDAAIMAIAGQWFVTGENLHKPDGYYYRSLGTPANVRGSDLIEFARAILAAQAAAPAAQPEGVAMADTQPTMAEVADEQLAALFTKSSGGPNPMYRCRRCDHQEFGVRNLLADHFEACKVRAALRESALRLAGASGPLGDVEVML
jgi:hypothetical protein